MAKGPSTFRQHDVMKAIKGAAAAGVNIARIEIARDGRIVIIAAAEAALVGPVEENQWDRV